MRGLERGAIDLREPLAEIFAHQRVAVERAGRVRIGGRDQPLLAQPRNRLVPLRGAHFGGKHAIGEAGNGGRRDQRVEHLVRHRLIEQAQHIEQCELLAR